MPVENKIRLVLETRNWREANLGQAIDKVLKQARIDVYTMEYSRYMAIRQQVEKAMKSHAKVAYITV